MTLAHHVTILSSTDESTDARLHRLCGALVRAGLQVDIWTLGGSHGAPAGVTFHRAPGGKKFTARIWRDFILPIRAEGSTIIVVAPDLLPMAYLVTRLRGQKLVADVHEDYLQLLRDRAWAKGLVGFAAKLVALAATAIAKRAELTTVADVQVPPFDARNRLVVRNMPDTSLLTPSGELDSKPRAIYIGDVRESRGLHLMLEIADRTPNWEFDIIGHLSGVSWEYVEAWKSASAASGRVRFHGKLAPQESWKFAHGAWVGLTLLQPTPAFIEAVPSKLYEYMAVGLATISTSLPRCAALIDASGGGVILDSAEEISDQLQKWATDPQELIAMREAALRWARQNLDSEREYGSFAAAVTGLKRG